MTQSQATILKKYAANIADTFAEDPKEMSMEAKREIVLGLLQDALAAIGKLYLVGGLPVLVDNEGNILRLMPGKDLDYFLDACGFMAGVGLAWDKVLSRKLQSRRDIPPSFVHSVAHFDSDTFALYMNEWSGRFLRIGPDGVCTRHQVGEFDVLFDKAEEPHPPVDLDKLNNIRGPALAWSENTPLVRFIFSIGLFAEDSGIGRQNCITVLMLFLLAIAFKERVIILPLLRLCGIGGTKKSALCVAIGWVLSGLGMSFHSTSCPENVADVENILINAKGFLVLDEMNALRPLTNLLKSVQTGGEIKRRVLYTTDAQRSYPVDVATVGAANVDSATDQALVDRSVKLDMGAPTSSGEEWRGDFGVREEWKRNNLRQQCWEDLVSRCAAAMRYLKAAADKGEDDKKVSHRMSGFWSFAKVIAHQESAETEAQIDGALNAIKEENRSAVNSIDDILPLLESWLKRRPEMQDKRLTAGQIGAAVMDENASVHVGLPLPHAHRPLSKPVQEILCSSYRLGNRLSGSLEYRRLLGLRVFSGDGHRHSREFSFHLPEPEPAEPVEVDPKPLDDREPEGK